jgi:DNA-binding CsgD family transcriptional regulator
VLEPILMTKREAEIVTCLFDGNMPHQIAKILGISRNTVDRHVANIREKAGAKSIYHLVAIAWKNGGYLY